VFNSAIPGRGIKIFGKEYIFYHVVEAIRIESFNMVAKLFLALWSKNYL